MNNINFKILGILMLLGHLSAIAQEVSPSKKRPNIIFIHVDQLSRLNTIGALGGEKVHTPAMDKLAEHGTSFTQSYSTDPVCCPARSSWFTGTWSSENGVVVNGSASHADIPDLSRILQGGGYKTFYTGKWHVPGKGVRKLFTVQHEGSWWGEISDPEVTASARSFLRNYNETEPFFLSIGYLNPHDICITPLIDDARIKKDPHSAEKALTKAASIKQHDIADFMQSHHYDSQEPALIKYKRETKGFPDWDVDMWYLHEFNYMRFVEMVDLEINLFLEELERSAWKENTIVIFSSDHGESMGRHELIGKGTLYEESVRVPFIVSTLGTSLNVSKNVVDDEHLVSGIDFARTVCDFAGIKSNAIAHGRSLRPLVEGEQVDDWRKYVYAETMIYMHMVRGQRYKYIREYIENTNVSGVPPSYKTHAIGVEQVFDLLTDPHEQKNLAYDKKYQHIRKKMSEIMNKKEDSKLPLREITHPRGRAYMKKIPKALREKEYPMHYSVK